MRMKMAFLLLVCVAATALVAQKIQPLNVKLGQWEVTTSSSRSGQIPIPPDMLAKLTPDQRAKVEERMKAQAGGATTTKTRKECLTKEKLEKDMMFDEASPSCTRTVATSTPSKVEVRDVCSEEGIKRNVAILVEALDKENVKGTIQVSASGGEKTFNVNSNFTAKWIGTSCAGVE